MGVGTLFRYLIGNREAIRQIAASRGGLWIGLLFVLSAGFARDYDGEDLTREPWHLLIPLGASVVSATLLFLLTYGPVWANDPFGSPFLPAYRAFLTLFWMTAPLAWLYAIPYERFLSPVSAVEANLWTLGVVAAWRVALMVRVLNVLMGFTVARAGFIVLAFADAAVLLAVWLMPKPVIDLMGGLHQTASERLLSSLTLMVSRFGVLSAPVLGIGALVALAGRKAWPPLPAERPAASRGLWALALASLAVWLPILPWTQSEQRLRFDAEQALRFGRIDDGLALMSAHSPAEFPPLWEPPPRIGYGEHSPSLWEVLDHIAGCPPAEWVRNVYLEKLHRAIDRRFLYIYGLTEHSADKIVRVLRRLPEGPAIVAENRQTFEQLKEMGFLSANAAEELKAMLGPAPKKQSGP